MGVEVVRCGSAVPSSKTELIAACVAICCACAPADSTSPATGDSTGGTGQDTRGTSTGDDTTDADGDSTSSPADADSSGGSETGTPTDGNDTESGSGSDSGSTGEPGTLGPYPDLALGPYPSLLTMAVDSMLSNTEALDTSSSYTHSAGQGYVLQAIGELLWAAREYDLDARDSLIEAALGEVAELQASADQVVGGGPGFGLPDAWDAFGDGSTNPAFTAYTWQSGMVALGVAKIARVLVDLEHPEADAVRTFGVELVQRWDSHYTDVADGGYWWYSTEPSDAIAVHNTSALVAMASAILIDAGDKALPDDRPVAAADLLWARMSGNPTDGYEWNYADDGYPVELRRAEDVSHALVTLQLMREARDRDWWSNSQAQGVAQTMLGTMWSGHPARLHGYVDGGEGNDNEWSWSRAAVIGYAAHGNTEGGYAEVFEYGRSLLFSSYLSRFERAFEGATVDSARTLALALMLTRRPPGFEAGSVWEMTAGADGDDAVPDDAGGVRFYTVDWADPGDLERGLTLPARASTAASPNLLVDFEDDAEGLAAVSITYSSPVTGTIGQWDGAAYQVLGSLPATLDDENNERWMRTTVVLDPASAFDYQAGVPGLNVLLALSTSDVAVHRVEATEL